MQINCKHFKMKTAKILGQTCIVNKILDKQKIKLKIITLAWAKCTLPCEMYCLETCMRMRERFIFIPIYFPEFDLSGAKLKLYYLFMKSMKKIQIGFSWAISPRCASRLSWKKLVTGLSTVCTSGSTYKLEMLVFIELISTSSYNYASSWLS